MLIEQEKDVLREQQEENARLVTYYRDMLDVELNKKKQTYPWLATHVADVLKSFDMERAKALKYKARPAVKASEEVAAIAKEKRALQKENRMLQYQISYYENLFPWLEEFKKVPPDEGWGYVHEATEDQQTEYEALKSWLSPEEYQCLSTSVKYQLALDRYNTRKKSDWEIGIEYERYFGYISEIAGAKVQYTGAKLGVEDMGRDLIVDYGDRVLVVQCKRWSSQKVIHEKHIFQLFGTTMLLKIKNPKKNYQGVFVTTSKLSDLARQCAERLEIQVIEKYPLREYPMIKCHDSPNGKIYHLPMDQQYDRVQIGGKPGSMFAWTVKEAEEHGFRRAHRWNPNKNNTGAG